MKKIVSWLAALSLAVSSMSMLTAGAEGTLSYVNEFTTSSDVWTNSATERGTVEVDEENGWLIINNQGKSETAGSFEGYCKAAMDFTDKYVKINASVKFDDFVSQKGLTFRTATLSSSSATVQWATVSGGALSFMGIATGKTLTEGEWYDFELKMDVSSNAASLTVTDKNGVVYSSGTTEMANDWTVMAGTERLGAIVFQDSQKATDSVMTIDRYELSEITESEMYPPQTIYETDFTVADGDLVGSQGAQGKWGRDSTRGILTIDTENEVMTAETLTTAGGGMNIEYTLNETLALAEREFGFEIDTKVDFGDFNSQKQFIVRNSGGTVMYANVNTDGSLVFLGESTGVILETEVNYNFKFMAEPITGKAYLLVTDEDDNIVYDSVESNMNVNEEMVKTMDNLTRVGFFAAKNTNVASVFTVDSFKLKEILLSDIPEPEEPSIFSDDFKTAVNMAIGSGTTRGKWAVDQIARGNIAHDQTQKDGVMVVTNNNANGGVVKGEYAFLTDLDVTGKSVEIQTTVKFNEFNSAKGLTLRINGSTAVEYVSVAKTGALSFVGNATGVTLSAGTWYTFKFQVSAADSKMYLLVTDENGNTVYDSSTQVLDLETTYASSVAGMTTIGRVGYSIGKHAGSVLTVDSFKLKEIDASVIPEMKQPDLSIIVSDDFSAGAWKNTHPARGTVTHDLTAGTMVITNKQSGTEEYPDAGSMNADLYLAEPVNVEDSVLKIESRVKFDDFNTDKGLELRIETTSSEDAIYKSTHQYASVAPESGELVFMGTYTGVYLLENTWYDFTFIMNTELGYGNLLVKNAEGVTVYDSVGKVLNWSTVRAKAYNNMLSISRIGFTVFSSEETDSTMTVDSCLAKFITDEEELAAIDFTSSIHASLPMIELNEDMTQITATVTTKVFKAENVGKNYKGYFATYKEDGTLLGVKSIPATTALSEASQSDTLVLTEDVDYIKTYLWDADNNLKPVMVSGLYELIRE